ncbi:hypothetical protein M6B38_185605 [Iris pallida]|uniref:Uncharacterized protein n=1 Tax=Iris pallida TaxID=29817 RepID=A0AAX6EJN3_IRIPA|nr:hypothetical protein M6B38_185605 [Iris pallida]
MIDYLFVDQLVSIKDRTRIKNQEEFLSSNDSISLVFDHWSLRRTVRLCVWIRHEGTGLVVKNIGETDDMLYTSYYSPADEATKDDLVQEVEPTADLEI